MKKRIQNSISLFLILVLMLTAVYGCGSTEDASVDSESLESSVQPGTEEGTANVIIPSGSTEDTESAGSSEEESLTEPQTEEDEPETSTTFYSGTGVPPEELPEPLNLWHKTEDLSYDQRTAPLLSFSPASGLYQEDITVRIQLSEKLPKDAKIYYTLDGNDPGEDDLLYDPAVGIPFEVHSALMVHNIKAYAVFGDYETYCFEQTYVMLRDAANLPGVDIVCVSSDEVNLYDYEKGIMVPGAVYDEEIETGQSKRTMTPLGNQGQRGDEWVRDGHVAIFAADGTLQTEQNIGLAVSGGSSVNNQVKSLKLSAGFEFDDVDKLVLTLVNEDIESANASFISYNNSIRLHAESQVSKYGNIRSSLMSRLAYESNFTGASPTKRCIVFLNNSYYGTLEFQQNYSNSFIAHHYGLTDTDSIVKLKGSEVSMDAQLPQNPRAFMVTDLDVPANREALEQVVDMDNFLLYHALNVLACNTDWPQNNYELWYYDGEALPGNPYSDGRYRYLIYDVDMTWITPSVADYFESVHGDTFAQLMTRSARAYENLFSLVMRSHYYRDRFVTLICDLLNTSFTKDNMLRIIEEEAAKIRKANSIYLNADQYDTSELFIRGIKSKAEAMEARMRDNFEQFLELPASRLYPVSFEVSEGASVFWNNMELYGGDSYSNRYYRGTSFTIRAEALPAYRFDAWTVNGRRVEGETLEVTSTLLQEGEGALTIRAEAVRTDGPLPMIEAVSASGANDRVRIVNAGNEACSLEGLTLSDRESGERGLLPFVTLEPGESLVLYGKNCPDAQDAYKLSFAISEEETLYLTRGSEVLDSVFVPKLDPSEYYARYRGSNRWKYILFKD